jgi:flavodoxin I
MKALIVYDSVFGNTEKIAIAMGETLASQGDVQVVRVSDLKSEQLVGLDCLFAGSPTRGFRPTPAMTEWLKSLPADSLKGVRVAAFDTRMATSDIKSGLLRALVNIGGYAAKPIADQLKKKGGEPLNLSPEGFFVKDREGPLKEGEMERAANWAKAAALPLNKPV